MELMLPATHHCTLTDACNYFSSPQQSLADSSTALQKELEVSYSAIGEQEKKFKGRIVTLRKQVRARERRGEERHWKD
jgi:hypothetical protein